MKKLLLASCIVAVSSGAQADSGDYLELKQGMAFTSSAVAGAVIGGPLGMMLGALGGAYVGEQMKQASQLDGAVEEMARLNQSLEESGDRRVDFERLALQALESRVLFDTGSDSLTEAGKLRLKSLAEVLKDRPDLNVRLDGFADPRGTDEYNNVLSHYRAESVRQALLASGVDETNIQMFSHGASRARVDKDSQGYAVERRVDIAVVPVEDAAVVQNHLSLSK